MSADCPVLTLRLILVSQIHSEVSARILLPVGKDARQNFDDHLNHHVRHAWQAAEKLLVDAAKLEIWSAPA
jgi:hypothetical protein